MDASLFGKFPPITIDESCEQANRTAWNTSTDGDCYGRNFSFLCISIHIFSFIIVVVNLFIFVNGILAVKKKLIKSIRICEFYLILNLSFADMMTGILSLIIFTWDFINEVSKLLSFKSKPNIITLMNGATKP